MKGRRGDILNKMTNGNKKLVKGLRVEVGSYLGGIYFGLMFNQEIYLFLGNLLQNTHTHKGKRKSLILTLLYIKHKIYFFI